MPEVGANRMPTKIAEESHQATPRCDQRSQFRSHTLRLKTEFSRLGLQALGIRRVSGVEPVPPLD